MEKQIYLDNASTTKVAENVVFAMNEFLKNDYGNPSSKHSLGKNSRKKIEEAREKISKFIGAKPSEIIFTSGGTESNNLAIKGLAKSNLEKKHIITSVIEHKSVLEVCSGLEKEGYEVDYVGVNFEGIVNIEEIKEKIREDTLVVSIMYVNNEIGTVQPIEEISKICKEKKVYFHSDVVQAFAKLELDVSKIKIDLLGVSAHKIHGPKGVGFLYVRQGLKINSLIDGGGQENGLRSGTENTCGIIGMAAALDVKLDSKKIESNRDKIIEDILKIPKSRLNGSKEMRIFNNINVSFYGIEGGALVSYLDKLGIYISTGSACTSSGLGESHVLKAIGVESMYIHGSIRISIEEIEEEDLKYVLTKIKEGVNRLREISPFKMEE